MNTEYITLDEIPEGYLELTNKLASYINNFGKEHHINLPKMVVYLEEIENNTVVLCWNTKDYYFSIDLHKEDGSIWFFRDRGKNENYGGEIDKPEEFTIPENLKSLLNNFGEDS